MLDLCEGIVILWALFYEEARGAFRLNGKEFRLICAGQRDPRRAAQTEMSARLKTSWLAGQRPTLKKLASKETKAMRWLSKQLKRGAASVDLSSVTSVMGGRGQPQPLGQEVASVDL